jgi:spore maturation protein B
MMINYIFSMIVPFIIASTAIYALYKKVDVYSALVKGAGDGLTIILRIFPALVALLTAIYMLRASGAMEATANIISPLLTAIGIPPETAPLFLVRPFSGSGALAVGAELIKTYGADSLIGRTAAVMLGSTETTFYTIAVYFGAAGITRTRHAIPAALAADLIGFIMAAFFVRLLFY